MLANCPPAAAEPKRGDSSKKLCAEGTPSGTPNDVLRGTRRQTGSNKFDADRGGRREDRGSRCRTVDTDPADGRAEKSQVGSVVQGKVKFFDNDRGFGFISRDGGDDVFVHVSNLQPGTTTLAEGQAVEFEVGPGRKSEEAKNVRSV